MFLTENSAKVKNVPVKSAASNLLPGLDRQIDFKVEKFVGINHLLQFAKPAVPPEAILKSVGLASYLDGQVIKLDTVILAQNFARKKAFSFPVLGDKSFTIKPEKMLVTDDGTQIYSGKVISQDPTPREVGFFHMVSAGEMIKGSIENDKEKFVLHYGRYGQYMLKLDPKNNLAID